MPAPYKTPNGNWYTSSLFLEEWRTNQQSERPIEPVFSFSGAEGYIDARRTFVELGDPTGYKWAMKYLKSWEHFCVLMKAKWFATEFQSWVEELKVIKKHKAIEKIEKIAESDSVQALAAARYIASAEWEKGPHGRGRPSKNELTGELKRLAMEAASDIDDARRVGLTIIPGGKA